MNEGWGREGSAQIEQSECRTQIPRSIQYATAPGRQMERSIKELLPEGNISTSKRLSMTNRVPSAARKGLQKKTKGKWPAVIQSHWGRGRVGVTNEEGMGRKPQNQYNHYPHGLNEYFHHMRERYIDKTEIQAERKTKNQRKEYRTTEAGCLASSTTKARQRDDSTMTSAKGK